MSRQRRRGNRYLTGRAARPRFNYVYIRNNPMLKVKAIQIGNSAGMVLPKEALKKLNVSPGDELYLIETPEGLLLTPNDQPFKEQMEGAERVMMRYQYALRQLAM